MFCSPHDCASPGLDSFEVQAGSCPWRGSTDCAISLPPSLTTATGLFAPLKPGKKDNPPQWHPSSLTWDRGRGTGLSPKLKVNFHETKRSGFPNSREPSQKGFPRSFYPMSLPLTCCFSCGHEVNLSDGCTYPWSVVMKSNTHLQRAVCTRALTWWVTGSYWPMAA